MILYGDEEHDDTEALQAILDGKPVWRPIATAPKDSWFLAFQPGRKPFHVWPDMQAVMGFDRLGNLHMAFVGGYDCEQDISMPTHWMPLPTPPAIQRDEPE